MKFINEINVYDYDVLTPSGFVPIKKIYETKKFNVWIVELTDGKTLECADEHILIDEFNREVFVKDLFIGKNIRTIDGLSSVKSIKKTDEMVNMFDLELDDDNHVYYTNNILSHNTTTAAGYILYECLFTRNKRFAILANKAETAREILDRIKMMFENLPIFLKPGVKEWNKSSISLANGNKIFASATSSSSIRGSSINCVPDYTKVCVLTDDEEVYYTSIKNINLINKSKLTNKENAQLKRYYTVYKITNKINNKEYIGFHSTNNLDDGYMGSGKLIKKAIEKYGVENFEKEFLEIFNSKEEALKLEKELVNLEYVLREDTYNLSIGGNVTILFGEMNGFFGKKHSEETKERIKLTTMNNQYVLTKEQREKMSDAAKRMWENPDIRSKIIEARTAAYERKTEEEKDLIRQKISDGNRGKIVSEESRLKISESLKSFHENITEENYQVWYNSIFNEEIRERRSASLKLINRWWQDKINKNPEKIRKTADAHRGMKRSEATKERMRESKLKFIEKNGTDFIGKGSIYIRNTETGKIRRVSKDFIFEFPWVKGGHEIGNNRGKIYINNQETGEVKFVSKDFIFEFPWVRGRGKKENW